MNEIKDKEHNRTATGSGDLGVGWQDAYNEVFDLLSKAELAARNGQWFTCGTWCKHASDVAFRHSKDPIHPTGLL